MTAPRVGVCAPWAELGDTCSPCNDYEFDSGVLTQMLQVASDVLFEFTGRRWSGECETTVRPHASCAVGCCSRLSRVRLPGYPIKSITTVKVDGVTLAASEYDVDAHRDLIGLQRADGLGRRVFPCCQRLDLADSEPDTFSVTYKHGADPPEGGVVAAAALACQLALACDDSDDSDACRLPERVTSVVRAGISYAVLDPLDLFEEGRTGLPEVDVWVAAMNRGAKMRPGKLSIPGISGVHRPTT